jgi:hypothetical protein
LDAQAFIARQRQHYVDQFADFVAEQLLSCSKGAAEVKFQLGGEHKFYRNLYCTDFIKNENGGPQPIELMPDRILTFDPIRGSMGNADLLIEHVRWDDIEVHHDATDIPDEFMAAWFDRWFDPDEKRYDVNAPLTDAIHSLQISPGLVSVDMGTAQPDAFWEILELLERAGATFLRVSSSRAEAESVG